jgi:hypothetical protein
LVAVEASDEKKAGWNVLRGEFCQASSKVFGDILEQATVINHVSMKPVLRTSAVRDGILLRLMKAWSNQKNGEEPTPLPLARNGSPVIDDLHANIANWLFVTYVNKTKLSPALKRAVAEAERGQTPKR